jgi:hypothetical protein
MPNTQRQENAMYLKIIIVAAIRLTAWGDDQGAMPPAEHPGPWTEMALTPPPAPTFPDRLSYPLFGRLMVSLDPYSGTGPYHFDTLSASPYYARYNDVEVGLRIGVIYPLTGNVMIEFQLPITANPSPEYQEPLESYGPLDGDRHLDASVGLLWSF